MRHRLTLILFISALCAGPLTSSASAATPDPVASAKQSVIAWYTDIYTNNSQACTYLSNKTQVSFIKAGRSFWIIQNLKTLLREGKKTEAQLERAATKAVPTCQAAVPVWFQVTKDPINEKLPQLVATVNQSVGQVVSAHKVVLRSKASKTPIVVILVNGRWVINTSFSLTS